LHGDLLECAFAEAPGKPEFFPGAYFVRVSDSPKWAAQFKKGGCPMKHDDEFKIAKKLDDKEGLVWILIIGSLVGVLLAMQMF
jgi:hypothetical protein